MLPKVPRDRQSEPLANRVRVRYRRIHDGALQHPLGHVVTHLLEAEAPDFWVRVRVGRGDVDQVTIPLVGATVRLLGRKRKRRRQRDRSTLRH